MAGIASCGTIGQTLATWLLTTDDSAARNRLFARLSPLDPVAYAEGLTVTNPRTTVTWQGNVYIARPDRLPFTTGAELDPLQWRMILNNGTGPCGWQPVVAELQAQIDELELAVAEAPGTLADLYNGADLPEDGDDFPPVPSVANTNGLIQALNVSLQALGSRTKYLQEQQQFLESQISGILPRLVHATPEMFGAVGDGIANDSAAFVQLNQNLAFGGTMELGAGKIYRAFGLSMSNVGRVINNGSVFRPQAEDLQVNRFVMRLGNTLPAITLTTPLAATEGSDRIPRTEQLSSVRVGDMLALKSTTARTWLNSGSSTPYYHGQYAVVVEITETDIIFSTPIYTAFPITSIEINRVPPYLVAEGVDIDVSATRSGPISVIGLTVVGYNMDIRGGRVIGNDFVAIGIQALGENGLVAENEVSGTLNGYGTGTARLGYGVNIGGNGVVAANNTFYNCKHGVVSAPRDIVSRGLKALGNRICSYRRAADPPFDVAMSAIDSHANTWDAFIAEGNVIDVEGHACTFRNGKVIFNKNLVVLRGSGILSVLSDTENPCTFLRASQNEIYLGNNHALFDLSESPNPANVTFSDNTVHGGRMLWSRNPITYDARGIKYHNNRFIGIRSLADLTLGAGSVYNLEFLGNKATFYASAAFGAWFTATPDATGVYDGLTFCGGESHDWAANTLTNHIGIDFAGATFRKVKLGDFKQRIQNGNSYTPNGILFRRSNVDGLDNQCDTDSEVTFRGDGVAVTWNRVNAAMPGARAEAIRFAEGSSPVPAVMTDVTVGPGAQIHNSRSASCVSFNFATTGAATWNQSNTVHVHGSVLKSAASTSVALNGGLSSTVGAPVAVRNNVMSGAFVDSTGGYAIQPLGNISPAAQPFRAGTSVRPDGRISGPAIPTSRAWSLGDIVYNSTPAAGQPKGWICTAAGTPGTWLSTGNL